MATLQQRAGELIMAARAVWFEEQEPEAQAEALLSATHLPGAYEDFVAQHDHGRMGYETEALVLASRAFFRNVGAIGDHLHKVHFYESEADVIIGRLAERPSIARVSAEAAS